MDKRRTWTQERSVVVHSNLLVAEDLRQLLLSQGAAKVVTAGSLDKVVAQSDAIAFVEGSAMKLADLGPIQTWLRLGTPIVAMNGGAGHPDLPAGMYQLEQPFRSEDVQSLLQKLKVF